ncbi:rRNA maturation RNase YbeY [Reichenbachiella versicolor]|uniref:rRNA maturation RNase YbeY n=1 Tax=Reichenbachiella versicolor TaxID=1821036 RepID=UPI000D6E478B|nr:rRNA maturation RNase YbeY [Reichenbachiella versicolor]
MSNLIEYFFEDINQPNLNLEQTSAWIKSTIQNEGYSLIHLNYIFCSDEYLHKINVEYLDHDYYTDIITFDNSEQSGKIEGDLFISLERITDNATSLNITYLTELNRVIIHGLLHLLGYNDKTENEQSEMTEKENFYLSKNPLVNNPQ